MSKPAGSVLDESTSEKDYFTWKMYILNVILHPLGKEALYPFWAIMIFGFLHIKGYATSMFVPLSLSTFVPLMTLEPTPNNFRHGWQERKDLGDTIFLCLIEITIYIRETFLMSSLKEKLSLSLRHQRLWTREKCCGYPSCRKASISFCLLWSTNKSVLLQNHRNPDFVSCSFHQMPLYASLSPTTRNLCGSHRWWKYIYLWVATHFL